MWECRFKDFPPTSHGKGSKSKSGDALCQLRPLGHSAKTVHST